MQQDPIRSWIETIKQVWPIVVIIFTIALGWASLDSRITAIENANRTVYEDVRWLRENMYNLLIKQGVQPVN